MCAEELAEPATLSGMQQQSELWAAPQLCRPAPEAPGGSSTSCCGGLAAEQGAPPQQAISSNQGTPMGARAPAGDAQAEQGSSMPGPAAPPSAPLPGLALPGAASGGPMGGPAMTGGLAPPGAAPGVGPLATAWRLKVVGIAEGYGEEQLRTLFALCGNVVEARIVHDKQTGRPVGCVRARVIAGGSY